MYIIEHRNYVSVKVLHCLLCLEAFFFFFNDILSHFTCTAWKEKDIFCYPNWDINLWLLQQEGQAACNLACSEVGDSEDRMCVFRYEFKAQVWHSPYLSTVTLTGPWVDHSLVEIIWKVYCDALILWCFGMFLIAFDDNQWPVYPDNYGENNHLAEFRLLQIINTPFCYYWINCCFSFKSICTA